MMQIRLFLPVFLLGMVACSTPPVNDNDPAALYKDAEEDIQHDRYIVALDKLRLVKNKFPYSNYSIQAQLRIADVYFLEESFLEAASAYELFRELHPAHEKASYATFRTGESYLKDTPGNLARDQTSANKALDSFDGFLKKYPSDPQAEEAKKRIAETRKILADKELYIGDFYYRRDFYASSAGRYKKILELYPETDAARVAKEKLPEVEKHLQAQ